jgi:endonuclease/exonuclease/phosphatase family metal-dependent hydrolase
LGPDYHVAPTGPSFHSRHPVAPLDRIIVTRELSIDAAGVHMSEAARRASDHLPIWARLSNGQPSPLGEGGSSEAAEG